MNKKLITLAVAGAMVAPLAAAADTTIYGRIHTSIINIDGDAIRVEKAPVTGELVTTALDNESVWDVSSETTRIGVKGSEDLGNGLKAIFQAEWAFSSSEGGSTGGSLANRLAYAGLTGGWGTAAIGRQWTPYYGAVDKADIFNVGSFNAQYIGTFRTGNAVAYVTPNFGGFVAKAAIVMDGADNVDDSIDAFNLSAEYNNGPFSIGAGYHDSSSADGVADSDGWGIGGSWNFGMFKLIGQYESWEVPDILGDVSDSADFSEYSIAGEAYFGKHTIRAMWGNLDYDADDTDNWALGYQYSMSKRTRVYAEYGEPSGARRDQLGSANPGITVGDAKIFGVGLRHDF